MFTIEQIKAAHAKVKSGADFPAYIKAIKQLGVAQYETFVADGNTIYHDKSGFQTESGAKYEALSITATSDIEKFSACLKAHQQGKSDYATFCKECAATGIEKWRVDMNEMTCTYLDKTGDNLLVEAIPVV